MSICGLASGYHVSISDEIPSEQSERKEPTFRERESRLAAGGQCSQGNASASISGFRDLGAQLVRTWKTSNASVRMFTCHKAECFLVIPALSVNLAVLHTFIMLTAMTSMA